MDHDGSNERVTGIMHPREDSVMETSNSDNHVLDLDLDLANLSEAEYLDRMLGPKYLPMKMVIPLTIVYVAVFVTGIFGNVSTCIVIVRNASMQTATNYYLFSLAISDLTLLILGERITLTFLPPLFLSLFSSFPLF